MSKKTKKPPNETVKGNNKHLTLDDRIFIEKSLDAGDDFKTIASHLQKSPSTISREVRSRLEKAAPKERLTFGRGLDCPTNYCKHQSGCKITKLCPESTCSPIKRCASCNRCNRICEKFEPDDCYKRLNSAPYVCNGCPNTRRCKKVKQFYKATTADGKYKERLVESRSGVNLTIDEHKKLDELISPLLKKGQPLFHIYTNNKDSMPCSQRSIYRYLDMGMFEAKNIDLPRRVRYKKRYSNNSSSKELKEVRKAKIGRTYDDLRNLIADNPELACQIVEMDTVMGCQESRKSLLTLYFVNSSLQLAFLLDRHTEEAVGEVFDYLEELLGLDTFRKLFFIIKTDNGVEFADPVFLESSIHGEKRTSIYYCDPYSSYQKAECEKNHEFIRYVIPKGTSMDNLIQEDIDLMMSHINSLSRPKYCGCTPYEVAKLYFGEDVLNKLGLTRIKADEINLKPDLLKKKK